MKNILHDMTRDKGSSKISQTKVVGLIGSIVLFATFIMGMMIMWKKQEIDMGLIGEEIGFVLVLLGFKNNFGFAKTQTNGNGTITNTIDINNPDTKIEKKINDDKTEEGVF